MKVECLTVEEINQLIQSGAHPNQIANEVHLWELKHNCKFQYPSHKPQRLMYVHPTFGKVPELG